MVRLEGLEPLTSLRELVLDKNKIRLMDQPVLVRPARTAPPPPPRSPPPRPPLLRGVQSCGPGEVL